MAGEGRGHATRVKAIVEQFSGRHEFTLFAPQDAYALLSSTYAGTSVRVLRIPGLMFHYSQQKMNYLRTMTDAATYLWHLNPLVQKLEFMIREEQPDLVITDFEPALPRAAERCHVPYLSIDHQHFLVDYDLTALPLRLKAAARAMAPMVRAYYWNQVETVISSFYFPALASGRRHVTQAGVLLRPQILNANPTREGHLLVYLRKFANPALLEALRNCGRNVLIYGLGEQLPQQRLRFLPINELTFLDDLTTCDALISNAGNQLIGEAIYLGKPVLAVPEAKNFEQFINAHFLRHEGGGDWVLPDRFDKGDLMRFLDQLNSPVFAVNRHRMNGLPVVLSTIERHLPSTGNRTFQDVAFQRVA